MKKVSVIIPAYNARKTIEKSLLSIATQVNVKELQTIIVNDAGEETYEDIVEKFKGWLDITLINLEENVGAGFARQAAIDKATTEYITFLDADDIYIDSLFLDGAVKYLDKASQIVLFETSYYREVKKDKIVPLLMRTSTIAGKLIRLSWLKDNDIMFTGDKFGEDTEFFLKLRMSLDNSQLVYLKDKKVFLYSYSENGITKSDKDSTIIDGHLYAYMRAFDNSIQQFGLSDPYKPELVTHWFHIFANYNHLYNKFFKVNKKLNTEVLKRIKKFYYDHVQDLIMYLKDSELVPYYKKGILLEDDIAEIHITYKDFMKLIEEE